jgi:hypothetical protein
MSKVLKELQKDFFRMLIFGASQSGKTNLLIKNIIPNIKKKYDEIIIFTPEFNENFYEKQLTKLKTNFHIYTNEADEIPDMLDALKTLQMSNIKGYNKEGEPIYKSNILIIFDDIISESLFKSPHFLQLFFHLRHLFMSTIVISQVTSNEISPSMISNTSFFVIFRVNGLFQIRPMIDLISSALFIKNSNLSHKKIRHKAKQLFTERLLKKDYGYIVIDQKRNLF